MNVNVFCTIKDDVCSKILYICYNFHMQLTQQKPKTRFGNFTLNTTLWIGVIYYAYWDWLGFSDSKTVD